MNVLKNLYNRIRFRSNVKGDESVNVVDSMARARKLFKELSILAHPDRNKENIEIAQELMQRIMANKHNYAELLKLQREVNEKLITNKP